MRRQDPVVTFHAELGHEIEPIGINNHGRVARDVLKGLLRHQYRYIEA